MFCSFFSSDICFHGNKFYQGQIPTFQWLPRQNWYILAYLPPFVSKLKKKIYIIDFYMFWKWKHTKRNPSSDKLAQPGSYRLRSSHGPLTPGWPHLISCWLEISIGYPVLISYVIQASWLHTKAATMEPWQLLENTYQSEYSRQQDLQPISKHLLGNTYTLYSWQISWADSTMTSSY